MDNIQIVKKILNSNKKKGVKILGDSKSLLKDSLDLPIKHKFADQVYLREMTIKKGMVVVGAIHNHLHIFFLLKGHLTLSDKNSVEDYEAPCYVISKPGIQRAVYANEDSIVINIHKNPDNIENVDELEKKLVSLNIEEYEEYVKNNKK
tara:strand:- start:1296 stop:1742 length:447 start_codon:yes stop_codon:yes gene_type:complete